MGDGGGCEINKSYVMGDRLNDDDVSVRTLSRSILHPAP